MGTLTPSCTLSHSSVITINAPHAKQLPSPPQSEPPPYVMMPVPSQHSPSHATLKPAEPFTPLQLSPAEPSTPLQRSPTNSYNPLRFRRFSPAEPSTPLQLSPTKPPNPLQLSTTKPSTPLQLSPAEPPTPLQLSPTSSYNPLRFRRFSPTKPSTPLHLSPTKPCTPQQPYPTKPRTPAMSAASSLFWLRRPAALPPHLGTPCSRWQRPRPQLRQTQTPPWLPWPLHEQHPAPPGHLHSHDCGRVTHSPAA